MSILLFRSDWTLMKRVDEKSRKILMIDKDYNQFKNDEYIDVQAF